MSCEQRDPLAVGRLVEAGGWSPGGVDSLLHLEECRDISASLFGALVKQTARGQGVEPRALAVRALLHLPRVASHEGWVSTEQACGELRISAERLRSDAWAASRHLPDEMFPLRDLVFEKTDPSRALPVLGSLHYLRTPRPGSLYFALVDPVLRRPVSLCSISPLQWKCVAREIRVRFAIPPQRVWDVSRVYSVDHAPPNAISSLLSRVRLYVRQKLSFIDLLTTAVDPNLGFTGSSYRAANWQHWMTVKARPYLYERHRYVSPRQLLERYGTASLGELHRRYPGRFQKSTTRLLDSMIYCSSVNGATQAVPVQGIRRLHR
jgi:hypothetical protein